MGSRVSRSGRPPGMSKPVQGMPVIMPCADPIAAMNHMIACSRPPGYEEHRLRAVAALMAVQATEPEALQEHRYGLAWLGRKHRMSLTGISVNLCSKMGTV